MTIAILTNRGWPVHRKGALSRFYHFWDSGKKGLTCSPDRGLESLLSLLRYWKEGADLLSGKGSWVAFISLLRYWQEGADLFSVNGSWVAFITFGILARRGWPVLRKWVLSRFYHFEDSGTVIKYIQCSFICYWIEPLSWKIEMLCSIEVGQSSGGHIIIVILPHFFGL